MAEKNSAQSKKQTNKHYYENNGHLAVNQQHKNKIVQAKPAKHTKYQT